MKVNKGKAIVLSIDARKVVAIGAANSIANGGRQNCFGLDVICTLNSPSQGVIRNQPTIKGMKVVNIRGTKEIVVSPWEANPTTVIIARAMISPRIRGRCFVML